MLYKLLSSRKPCLCSISTPNGNQDCVMTPFLKGNKRNLILWRNSSFSSCFFCCALFIYPPSLRVSSLWNEGLNVHLGRWWPSGSFTHVHLCQRSSSMTLSKVAVKTLNVYTCRLHFIQCILFHLIDSSIRLALGFVST